MDIFLDLVEISSSTLVMFLVFCHSRKASVKFNNPLTKSSLVDNKEYKVRQWNSKISINNKLLWIIL